MVAYLKGFIYYYYYIYYYKQIYLLNTDYKLMILATRLKRRLRDTFSPPQKGGVPGRIMSFNLCLNRDVIHCVGDRNDPEEHLFSQRRSCEASNKGVDLEKAYDLVNRDLLWRITVMMGYPMDTKFIHRLQTMYSAADITILNGSL